MIKYITVIVIVGLIGQTFAGTHGHHGKGKEITPNLPPLPRPAPPPPSKETQQVVATCYKGYTLLSDGTCVKEIVEEALPAEGEVLVPYITRCPPGFVAKDAACFKTGEIPLAYFCPVGFYDDGFACAKTIPGETALSCNAGELINGVCILTEQAPHIVTPRCPEGSIVEKDGNCWKVVETFDCTPKTGKEEISGRVITRPEPPIPLGKKIVVSKGPLKKLRSLHAPKKLVQEEKRLPFTHPGKNSVPGKLVTQTATTTTPKPLTSVQTACPKKEFVSVAPPHPTKVGPISQLCAKKVEVDALVIVSCPEGFEDFGEECIKETTTSPITLCLTDGSTNGNCPPFVERVPKLPQCADGRPPNKHGKCIEVETVPAENLCAEGFRDTGNGCLGLVKSGGLECRPGLTLNGDKCIGKSVRPSVALTLKPKPGCENKY